MKGLGLALGIVALSASCTRAPDTGFDGTWVMILDGRPFLVLTLESEGDHVVGSLAHPQPMTTDGRSFSRIGTETVVERVTSDAPRGNTLRIVSADPASPGDTKTFDMSQTSADHAWLKLADAPFEPWPLERHAGSGQIQVWTGWDPKRSYALQEPYVEPNAEMAAIYAADQAVRQSMESFRANVKQIEREDAARRERTQALLDAGELRAAEDYRLAAMVFQHGVEPRHYLFAHTLALVALATGDRSASWIAAASLDRYLHSIGQPQIMGTQFGLDGTSQGAFDGELIPDALRRELGVPAVSDQQELMKKLLEGRPAGTATP